MKDKLQSFIVLSLMMFSIITSTAVHANPQSVNFNIVGFLGGNYNQSENFSGLTSGYVAGDSATHLISSGQVNVFLRIGKQESEYYFTPKSGVSTLIISKLGSPPGRPDATTYMVQIQNLIRKGDVTYQPVWNLQIICTQANTGGECVPSTAALTNNFGVRVALIVASGPGGFVNLEH